METMTDTIISLKDAGFDFGQIVALVLIMAILLMVFYFLKNNTVAMKDLAKGIMILTYQNKSKFLNEEESEKKVDAIFEDHINKKWILLCDLMDENGFGSESRRKVVKENISNEFDRFTGEEKEDLDEYLFTFGDNIIKNLGSKFFNMYLEIEKEYKEKTYKIVFDDNRRAYKKRDFFALCRGELVKIKTKLKS